MLALLMVGGRGRRMISKEEKPMSLIKGKPMISYVFSALKNSSCFERIMAVISDNTPNTAWFLAGSGAELVKTAGNDYVEDLNYALEHTKPNKAFVISGDMPLIDITTIQKIVYSFDKCTKPCLTVMVSKAMLDDLDVSVEYCLEHNGKVICNTGVCIIDTSKMKGYSKIEEEYLVMDKMQLAINVNTKHELRLAETFLKYDR